MISIDTILTINVDYHEIGSMGQEDKWLFGVHLNVLMLKEESYMYLVLDNRSDLPLVVDNLDIILTYISGWLKVRLENLSYNETVSDIDFNKLYILTENSYKDEYVTLEIQTYLCTPKDILDWFKSITTNNKTLTFKGGK